MGHVDIEERRSYARDYVRRKRGEQRTWCFAYKGGARCVDCGYDADPRGLEFDHVPGRGPKQFVITYLLSVTEDVLRAELDKCDVVCGTCHNIRTAARRGIL
jgi:hypothetical protein